MSKLLFTQNESPTIGVEVELQIIDAKTLALSNSIEQVLAALPERLKEQVKPELMQCYLEINTGICRTVAEAGDDLRNVLGELEKVTDGLGLKLLWSGTHPFSSWKNQQITVNERYYRLVELMQDVARRLVTFGLHVHIGVDTGDKAIAVCDRMLRHLPLLLALSVNSPFWEGRNTGLQSNRSKVMQDLPTAGLPHQMRNYSEYTWIVNHLIATGFINTIRELWWDIRPHHNFGTVEVRICDVPANLRQVLALTALVQCLVQAISEEVDEGTYQREYHPMMVEQNKWRATRFGADAHLVSSIDYRPYSVEETLEELIEKLRPMARRLGCLAELESAAELPKTTGAKQQLAVFEETGNLEDVVRRMLEGNTWR